MRKNEENTSSGKEALSYEESIKIHRANRHKQFMLDAANVFARVGIPNISMDKLAEELGVTKVVLYRYFASKDALVDSILGSFLDKLLSSDTPEKVWGPELVQDNLDIVRANKGAALILLRHVKHSEKFSHHYKRLSDELLDHTIIRISKDKAANGNSVIQARFLADRLGNFIFDAFEHWIVEGDEQEDKAFVGWLVRTCRSMVASWQQDDFDSRDEALMEVAP